MKPFPFKVEMREAIARIVEERLLLFQQLKIYVPEPKIKGVIRFRRLRKIGEK